MGEVVISAKNITKTFKVGVQDVPVLKGISFDIERGDFAVILGPSGCGKSTLLHILLGLEYPSTGVVSLLGKNLYKDTTEDDRSEYRKKNLGMIYQQPNWIKSFNVMDNIRFPLLLSGTAKDKTLAKANTALSLVNMTQWAFYLPSELSGGQQQRIAFARAIITDPELIIADEPTGNLDYTSGQQIMELMQSFCQEKKRTILMVTHDLEYLKYANKTIRILDGKVVGLYGAKETQTLASQVQSKRGQAMLDIHKE